MTVEAPYRGAFYFADNLKGRIMQFKFDEKKLAVNPYIYTVDQWGFTLTSAMRVRLYKEWKKDGQTSSGIAKILEEAGLGPDVIGKGYASDLGRKFTLSGFPVYRLSERNEVSDYEEENPLLLSGKFIRTEKGNGIIMTPSLRKELAAVYPDTTVEEGLRQAGIDPVDVGHQRMRKIENDLKADAEKEYKSQTFLYEDHEGQGRDELAEDVSPVTDLERLRRNPYVLQAGYNGTSLKDSFYNEAYLLYPLGLKEILKIYEMDASQFTERSLVSINSRLYHWTPTAGMDDSVSEQILRIRTSRADAMNRLIGRQFEEIGKKVEGADITARRRVCQWIRELPRDPQGYYTNRRILSLTGIGRSTYYAILNDENYGGSKKRRADQDERDLSIIKEVLAYKGFEKGIRQVYMLMPKITGEQFSMYRIRRIMNKYGIRTTIRRPSMNRKAMKELIARNKKANLLMRQFRMHRPNEVRLTDVTYLDYGDGLRAYGSASVDPVTGRLICFIVSENNDLQLALDTLKAMDEYPAKNQAILHSDQGILYMTDDFQAAVIERNLSQSMSRRGNCWDNAPQESFHGHFKDECHYEKCRTIEELREMIREYSVYYNNERGMWNRGKMTPVEYEDYLNSMSEEEFREYLSREEQKYQEMKEKSAEKAVQEARDYRDSIQRQREGSEHEDQTGR